MKLLRASFAFPVRVPGQPGDRRVAGAGLNMALVEGQWVRMECNGDVVFVPMGNVVSFEAAPVAEPTPKAKRSPK